MKMTNMKMKLRALALCLAFLVTSVAPLAQGVRERNLAPGAPGKDARWESAGKTAVGSSNTLDSKVWFTLRKGVMTEVYYPTVDVGNSRLTQFVVVSADGRRVETEEDDTTHRVEIPDPQALVFRQINRAKSGAYTITKTYVADPERSTVLINVAFESRSPHTLYVYHDPSLNNSGMYDSAWTEDGALLSSDADKATAVVSSTGFTATTNGYFETESDGLAQLRKQGRIVNSYPRAADGNVVQLAQVRAGAPFTLALGFGREGAEALRNARLSLAKGFQKSRSEYEAGWHSYVRTLRRVAPKYQALYDMAAMVLKAHEDKTYRGAMIASLSVPWGGGASANEPQVGGYHLVWSRDLYQVATAFHALGDKASADRALDYLFRVQQKPDGSFPQNSWLDGRPFWGSLQLDEVAYPLILAAQLGRTDNETWTKHVKPAADFIVLNGPRTPQERWEEEDGYSPSTIAAEIAGLVSAAEIARRNNDEPSARIYLAAADEWARNIEAWTVTTTGPHAPHPYYIRINQDLDPDDGDPRELNNGAGTYDERAVVDAGFLELVRLGIKPPDDPLIERSVAVVDKVIRVETPKGVSFYRYNHDGYGEMDDGRPWNWDGKYTGGGRLWVLLAGERGQYELARGEREAAERRLDAMMNFANEGRMLPEQVWDRPASPTPDLRFGEGTGSATPLAWSMAQFIRLATNLQEGRNLDTPSSVAARYLKDGVPHDALGSWLRDGVFRREAGTVFTLESQVAPRTRVFVMTGDSTRELQVSPEGRFKLEIPVERGEKVGALAFHSASGATSFVQARIIGTTEEDRRAAARAEQTPQFIERLKKAERSPLVEDDKATFIYRGKAKRVLVVGDHTGWSVATAGEMRDVAGTDLKYLTLEFPKSARVEYKLVADGEWILDPLNPNRNDNGVGGHNSNFTMPGYRPTPYARGADDLGGKLETLALPGDAKRKVQVYLPPGYSENGGARYPVLYMQDGSQFLRLGRAAEVADRMIRSGEIKPFIIVFIDPLERNREYWASDDFAGWMAKTLVPLVDSRYRTRAERDGRALLGASLGGVISVWTALKHPEVFSRAGGHSSAFQIDEGRVLDALSKLTGEDRRAHPIRFYLDTGRLEPLVAVNRRARLILASKGYPVTYVETDAGHNYTTWRDRLADAFKALWAEGG